jgi:hypothetical protein
MANQPTAKVSIKDIERIILRDYPKHGIDKIIKMLSAYKSDTDGYRVWAALLKISKGNIEKLICNIENANYDYRDTLSEAEYPEYFRKTWPGKNKLTDSELKLIIQNDWNNYLRWFNDDRSNAEG